MKTKTKTKRTKRKGERGINRHCSPCQVPKLNFPFVIGIETDEPMIDALVCDTESLGGGVRRCHLANARIRSKIPFLFYFSN